jgi:hypothetical protein
LLNLNRIRFRFRTLNAFYNGQLRFLAPQLALFLGQGYSNDGNGWTWTCRDKERSYFVVPDVGLFDGTTSQGSDPVGVRALADVAYEFERVRNGTQ